MKTKRLMIQASFSITNKYKAADVPIAPLANNSAELCLLPPMSKSFGTDDMAKMKT